MDASRNGGPVAVATDRNEGSDLAVAWAADLAGSLRVELVAIQVLAPLPADQAGDTGAGADVLRQELERSLPADGFPARAIVARGEDVAATITEEAKRAGATVLVVGSSGMRGRKQFLLGNVANRVTHLARCTVVVVNTTTGEAAEADAESDTGGTRAAEIARVLGPELVRQLSGRLLRSDGDPEGPRRLRLALEQLGPTFSKLGQILSTRPDLLPEDYLAELALLQSDVPSMSEAEVVAVMEQELRVPWEDVFSSIEPSPLAAGTIGQVHRARLADGHRVVIKVQRPSAASVVERDLALLGTVVRPISRSTLVRRIIDVPSLVEQVSESLRRELDFGEEARNLDRMAEILARSTGVGVPACHHELSTPRLLVMDEVVDGVPLSEAPRGPGRTEATRELLQVYYRQVLDEGFFHADPHPGNMLWAGGKIWLLDLGMVGRLDAETRRRFMLVLLAFAQGDVELLADVSLDVSGTDDVADIDMDAYRADLAAVIESVQGRSLEEIRLVELLNRLTTISVRHGVAVPSEFVMVAKALGQVELTVSELAPDLDPMEEARRFFLRSIMHRLAGRLDPGQLVYEVERLRYRLGQFGEGVATVSGSRPGRRLEVRFSSARLERKVIGAGRMVALGLGAGLTWVAAAEASSSERVDPRLARSLQGFAAGLSAWFATEVARNR
jgi:predicted unusual protein kinase regulating ubiquinone biosynthesis (AarF/ABC1/UbiB family)/nucleotide-binding universal stress UspA family protein